VKCPGIVCQGNRLLLTHTLCVCIFVYCRPTTLIISNVLEIFQYFQKLGKGANIACPFDV